jgi:hypothetical protein
VACIVRAVCVGVFVTTKSGWYGIMVVIVYFARGGGDSVFFFFQTCVSVGASQAFKASQASKALFICVVHWQSAAMLTVVECHT